MCKKRLVCVILAMAMMLTVLQGCFITAYSDSVPTLIVDDISTIARYGSGYYNSSNTKAVDVNEEGAPVNRAYQYVCSTAGSNAAMSGIRSSKGFEIPTDNTYVVLAYWVKATLDETVANGTKPVVRANLRYVKATNSSGSYIDETGDMILPKENVWYRCMRVIKIADKTTGEGTGDKSLIRFEIGASAVAGQTTLLGGYSVYSFGTGFAYGDETETVAAIKAYIKDNKLSSVFNDGIEIGGFNPSVTKYTVAKGTLGTITATAKQSVYSEQIISQSSKEPKTAVITVRTYDPDVVSEQSESLDMVYTINEPEPGESVLTDNYSYSSWSIPGVDYRGAAAPLKDTVDGREAIKFWGKDSAFVQNNIEIGNGGQYRGQLNAAYLDGSETWNNGDKFYISFYAKAHSNYGNTPQLKTIMQGVKSTGGGGNTLASGELLSLTDSWKKYSMVLTMANRADTDAAVRICLNLGYKGQITYLSDFKMHKCNNGLSDAYILNYFDGKFCENISKNETVAHAGLSTYGHHDKETVSDPSLPFTSAEKFYSDPENYTVNSAIGAYRARKSAGDINQENLVTGDKIMLIYWAKGSVDTNATAGQTAAKIRPLMQKDSSGGNAGTVYRLTPEGTTDEGEISLTEQWKRYVSIYELPDMGENTLRFEWQLGYKGQTVYLADVQIYNLGQITTAEAFSKIGINDLNGYYKTRKMNCSVSEFTADVEYNGNYSFENVTVDSEYPFVEYIKMNDSIKAIAPDGTEKTYTINAVKMDRIGLENISYKPGSAATKVILKMDDLSAKTSDNNYTADAGDSIEGFKKIVDICKAKGITASFGVVGRYWENASTEQWEMLKSWQDAGFEIWHHGWDYTAAEYSTESYESQYQSFKKTMDLMKEHDINIRVFGSPENNSTVITSQMIVDKFAGDIDATLLVAPNEVLHREGVLNLSNRVNLESETGVADINTLTTGFDTVVAQNNADYVVIQAHPSHWQNKYVTTSGETDYFSVFESAIDYLMEKDVEFVTPSQYKAMRNYSELANIQSGDITAIVTLSSGYADAATGEKNSAVLIYALYNKQNNQMVSCDVRNVSVEPFGKSTWQASVTVPDDGGNYETRLFVWDSLDGLVPCGNVNFLSAR